MPSWPWEFKIEQNNCRFHLQNLLIQDFCWKFNMQLSLRGWLINYYYFQSKEGDGWSEYGKTKVVTHLVLHSKLCPQLWTSCSLSRPLISPWSSLAINPISAFLVTSGLLLCHTYFHSFRFTMLQLYQHFQSKCDTFHSSGRSLVYPLLFFSKYTRKHQKSVDERWSRTWRTHDAAHECLV